MKIWRFLFTWAGLWANWWTARKHRRSRFFNLVEHRTCHKMVPNRYRWCQDPVRKDRNWRPIWAYPDGNLLWIRWANWAKCIFLWVHKLGNLTDNIYKNCQNHLFVCYLRFPGLVVSTQNPTENCFPCRKNNIEIDYIEEDSRQERDNYQFS